MVLWVPPKVTVRLSAGAASSDGSTGAGGAASRVAPSRGHSLEASCPVHVGLSTALLEPPHDMGASPPPPARVPERTRRSPGPFMTCLGRDTPSLVLLCSSEASYCTSPPSQGGQLGSTSGREERERICGRIFKPPQLPFPRGLVQQAHVARKQPRQDSFPAAPGSKATSLRPGGADLTSLSLSFFCL